MFVEFLLMFVAWAIVPFLLLMSKKYRGENKVYPDPNIKYPRKLRRLPSWARWFETPDDITLPGGLYEPTVYKIYQKYGWFISSWYWISLRNVAHGVMWNQGHEIDMHINAMSSIDMQRNKVFNEVKKIGPFKLIYGYKSVNDWYELKTNYKNGWVGLWAVPRVTIRMKSQK